MMIGDRMRKLLNKVFLLPGLLSIIVITLMLTVGSNGNVIYNTIMSNSVTSSYYYCKDSSYTLKGDKCIKFEYSDQLLAGDANLDGNFDIKDVTYIQLYINNRINFDASALLVSDVNKDGSVNKTDLELIQKAIANSTKITNGSPSSISDSSKYEIGKEKICLEGYLKNSNRCYRKSVINATKVDFIYGDINSDTKIDEIDASLLSNYLDGSYSLNDIQKKTADINQDSIIDINDLNQINSIILENDKNSVSATISVLNNVNLNEVRNNTNIEFEAKFNISLNRKYYYKWFDVKKTDNVVESKCMMIPNNRYDKYSITATDNNEYVLLKIYNDSNCNSQINLYKTDEIKIKEEVSSIDLDYKLLSPMLTTSIVNKDTELKFYSKFNVVGSKQYYYKWNVYNDNIIVNNSKCSKVTTEAINHSLKVNAKDVYGNWQVYSDSACTNLVGSYKTEKYNYLADSISLNINSSRLNVSSNLKLQPIVKSNLDNINDYIKWSSSNTAVATVDKNGVVVGKKKGSAKITATIGNISSSADINVVDIGNDTSIECPMLEYEKKGDLTTITVNKNSTFNKYDVYLSTNDHVGYWAGFENINKNVTSSISFNNKYKNSYSNQAKIVVYNNYGTSRNCYTPPLTWKWNTVSTSATCSSFKYKYDKVSGANTYTYQMDGVTTKSGISKLYVAFDLNSNYQYSWYTSQKDGGYRLFKTYSTSSKDVEPSVTGQYYNRNGQVVVTDSRGNSIICKTEAINNQSFEKNTVGSTDIYSEKGFNTDDKNSVINVLKKMKNESPANLAASTLFLYKSETYMSIYGNSCGNYRIASNNIAYSESKNRPNGTSCGGYANSTYYKGAIKHEFGHSMDHMNELITGVSLSNSMYNGKLLKNYSDAYNMNKKQCNGDYCLRYREGYTYGDANYEFLADLISYDYHDFKMNNELFNLRKQIMSLYYNNYQNNKSKFNQIKESFR